MDPSYHSRSRSISYKRPRSPRTTSFFVCFIMPMRYNKKLLCNLALETVRAEVPNFKLTRQLHNDCFQDVHLRATGRETRYSQPVDDRGSNCCEACRSRHTRTSILLHCHSTVRATHQPRHVAPIWVFTPKATSGLFDVTFSLTFARAVFTGFAQIAFAIRARMEGPPSPLTKGNLAALAEAAGDANAAGSVDWEQCSSAAHEAICNVKKAQVQELKSYAKPPNGVILVLECVAAIHGTDKSWANAKKSLADPKFFENILHFDISTIDAAMLKRMKPYIENPAMAPEAIWKVSKAVAPVAMWVHAVYQYATM